MRCAGGGLARPRRPQPVFALAQTRGFDADGEVGLFTE